MSDKDTLAIIDGLRTAAGNLADKLFMYGDTAVISYDPDGIFGEVTGPDGKTERYYLFEDKLPPCLPPNAAQTYASQRAYSEQYREAGERMLTNLYGAPAGGSMKD